MGVQVIIQAELFGFFLVSATLLLLFAARSTVWPTAFKDFCLDGDGFPLSCSPDPIGGTGDFWLAELFLDFWLADGGFGDRTLFSVDFGASPLLDVSVIWLDDFSGELDLSKEEEIQTTEEKMPLQDQAYICIILQVIMSSWMPLLGQANILMFFPVTMFYDLLLHLVDY